MSAIELIAALLSFVYALALTHLLQSAAELWLARRRVRFSLGLAAWMFLSCLMLVNNWLALIPLAKSEWSQSVALTAFVIAVVQYFTCALCSMKPAENGRVDMRAFEEDQDEGYKVAYLAMTALVVFDTGRQYELIMGAPFSWSGLFQASWTMLAFALAIAVSLCWKARWFQLAVPIAYCGFLLWVMSLAQI